MQYKFFVYCPDEEKLIQKIIDVASEKGAGVYGNYSHVAFVTHGNGYWVSEEGAHPVEGEIGKQTKSKNARIEMTCPAKKIDEIVHAIKTVHPWEQVDIECMRLSTTK